MTLKAISANFGEGGVYGPDVRDALKELQGLTMTTVAGASATSVSMAVAALRSEDTLLAVLSLDAFADDKANCTIIDTHASGTLVVTGTPTNGQTFAVDGVTYTMKTVPAAATDVLINTVASSVGYNAMAASIAAAINSYENRLVSSGGVGGRNVAQVSAVAAVATVTITSVADGVGNAPIVTSSGGTLSCANSGTASVTATTSSVIATNYLVVNGVTFTARATLSTVTATADVEFRVTTTTEAVQATEIARAINAYEEKYGTLDVTASTTGLSAIVTIVPKSAKKGNIIPLSAGNATGVAASGAALAGGTATGGFTSGSNLSGKTLLVVWWNKHA